MIENNPSNVSSAFDLSAVPVCVQRTGRSAQAGMLLEEVEAEIDFVNGVGSKAFEGRDYDKAKEALESDDHEQVVAAKEQLTQASHKMATAMYGQPGSQGEAAPGAQGPADPGAGEAGGKDDGEVIDAEFEEKN